MRSETTSTLSVGLVAVVTAALSVGLVAVVTAAMTLQTREE